MAFSPFRAVSTADVLLLDKAIKSDKYKSCCKYAAKMGIARRKNNSAVAICFKKSWVKFDISQITYRL